ncbi:MAG: altronate dehydratase family protein [Gemmatales bacterium]|nr:altronate dehydratase family protein [Gemmatales bacterium]MDW7994645.1 altronate dehydratase family protein [Gemmatales bacterium]
MTATPSCPALVRLRPEDNVAVAARDLRAGETLMVDSITLQPTSSIALGHKIALVPIRSGEPIRKFGQIIGFASRDIARGEHVHVHNVRADRFQRDYAFCSEVPPPPQAEEPRYFYGYDRGDGRYGTRNYLAIISTVNCSASVSKYISERVRSSGLLRHYPNVDGVIAITHKSGCAIPYEGPDHQQLERTLAGFARHANVAAFLLVGLGCETAQAWHLLQGGLLPLGRTLPQPTVLTIQECGGIARTVEAGVQAVAEILPRLNDVKRVPIPASQLILATQCGGSDGNSGITANPALGYAADLLVAQGGTVVLAETPEIYGAEHLLTRRAISRAVAEKLLERIRWWEWYVGLFGAEINNNPSPGNKAGGLTTIYEKSLGAIAKGGTTALRDVVLYAQAIHTSGLVVMDTPGYDPVSMTGLVAGGCNIAVFTTGRGSVYGCKPVPTIKVATNTPLYERMSDDMDIDAGVILSRGVPIADVGRQIFEEILAVASGKKTKSELHGVGEEEFAPWQIGPIL